MAAPNPLAEHIAAVRNDPQFAARRTLPSELIFVKGGVEGNRLILKRDSASKTPPPAVLRIIGQITRSRHALRPSGTYSPTNRTGGENVTKAKLRFVINAPNDEHFSECIDDYDQFIQNLRAIHNSDVDSSKSPTMFRPIADSDDVTVLHPLVVPYGDECADPRVGDAEPDTGDAEVDTIASQEETAFPDACTFEGWPVDPNGEWRRELNTFKETHDINPMRAFDVNGKLILPLDYARRLVDAIVDLSFTLIHYNFVQDVKWRPGSSRMCLYLAELHVLVPPTPLPTIYPSPVKKIIKREEDSAYSLGEGSPTKKRRVD